MVSSIALYDIVDFFVSEQGEPSTLGPIYEHVFSHDAASFWISGIRPLSLSSHDVVCAKI